MIGIRRCGGIEKGEEARPEASVGAMQSHCFGGNIYDELEIK
jgi:hypothetical protein